MMSAAASIICNALRRKFALFDPVPADIPPPVKQKSVILGSLVFLCFACGLAVFWKPLPLDLSQDELPFRSMILPPQKVFGDGYMDGGSVGVVVIDRSGTQYEITFPIAYGKINHPYPTAFYGNFNDPMMVPLKNPERAKQIVIRLLSEHGTKLSSPAISPDYDGTQMALRALSNPSYVKASRLVDHIKRSL